MSRQKTNEEYEAEILKLRADIKKAKAKARRAEQEEDEEVLEDPDFPGESRVVKLAGLVSELSDSGSFEIYQLSNDGTRMQVGAYDFNSVKDWRRSMETVLRVKGGGDYETIFRDDKGKQIGQIKRRYDPDTYKPAGAQAAAPSSAAPASDYLEKILKLQAERDAEHRKEVEILRNQMVQLQGENTKMMFEFMKASQKSPINTVQELAAFKQLFSPKESELDRMLELRDTLDELRDEAARRNDPIWATAISRLVEGVARVLPIKPDLAGQRSAAPSGAAELPAPKPQPAAAVTPAAPATPSGAPATDAVERPSLVTYVQALAASISHGHTPAAAAEWVDSQSVSEKDRKGLIELIAKGDWDTLPQRPEFQNLKLEDGTPANAKAWLEEFRKRLAELTLEGSPT